MSGAKKLMGTTAVGGGALAIEDVFSTYLYTGTGAYKTITNGIDLAGEGGMVWIKQRSVTRPPVIFDTERGATNYLPTDSTTGELTNAFTLTNFYSDGFRVRTNNLVNTLDGTYASWTFRKAPRFFDVVTYTGDGVSGRTISHNLGIAPGCVIVKRTDSTRGWGVYHRSIGATNYLVLESTQAAAASTGLWNDTEPTDSVFTVGNNLYTNGAGATYVAYLFAHDPLGPSGDGSDGLIACGSYTGNGSTDGPEIDLGWEPQWVMVKRTDDVDAWNMYDVMRGWQNGTNDSRLRPDTSDAESYNAFTFGHPTATGFKIDGVSGAYNASGGTYIYIAIRRGPMRQPTSGTEVFAVDQGDGTTTNPQFVSNFSVDLGIWRSVTGTSNWETASRLTGQKYLRTNSTGAELGPDADIDWDFMTGFYGPVRNTSFYSWMFRRAPSFFDVVAYTGDGANNHVINHNLGVSPEIILLKRRDVANSWNFATQFTSSGYISGYVNSTSQFYSRTYGTSDVHYVQPTDAEFTVNNYSIVNASGGSYIAYLFASCPGVSKVGSYTGNGSSQTIDCGFTSGARFVLIKRTDTTGNWKVMDTARGIVAAGDPYLELNNANAEFTGVDVIDPDASGFSLPNGWPDFNASGGTYIFLAIA